MTLAEMARPEARLGVHTADVEVSLDPTFTSSTGQVSFFSR
jgi:hypothetical protein